MKKLLCCTIMATGVLSAPVWALDNPTVVQYTENQAEMTNNIQISDVLAGEDLSAVAQTLGAKSVVYQPEGGTIQVVLDDMTNLNSGNLDTFIDAFRSEGYNVYLSAYTAGNYQDADLGYKGGTSNVVPVQTDGIINIGSLQLGDISSKVLAVEIVSEGDFSSKSVATGTYTSLLLNLLNPGQVAAEYGPNLVVNLSAIDEGSQSAESIVRDSSIVGDAYALANASGVTVAFTEYTSFKTDGDKVLIYIHGANSGGISAYTLNEDTTIGGSAEFIAYGSGVSLSAERTNEGQQAGGNGMYLDAYQGGEMTVENLTENVNVAEDLTKQTGASGAQTSASLAENLGNQYDSHRGFMDQLSLVDADSEQTVSSSTAHSSVGGSFTDSLSNTGALNTAFTESNNLNLLWDSSLDLPSGAEQSASSGATLDSTSYSSGLDVGGDASISSSVLAAGNEYGYQFNAFTQFKGELNTTQEALSYGEGLSNGAILSDSDFAGNLDVSLSTGGAQNVEVIQANRLLSTKLGGSFEQTAINSAPMSSLIQAEGLNVGGDASFGSSMVGAGNTFNAGAIPAP